MYERFTDRARKVMQLANQESQRLGHEYVGTEHILLGLSKEGSGVGANVLNGMNISLDMIKAAVDDHVQSGYLVVTVGKLPLTPRAKKVIDTSMAKARSLNHNYVGTEHILLGILSEPSTSASEVLTSLGVNLENVLESVLNLLGRGGVEQPALSPLEQQLDEAVANQDFEKAMKIRNQINSEDRLARMSAEIKVSLDAALVTGLSSDEIVRVVKDIIRVYEY